MKPGEVKILREKYNQCMSSSIVFFLGHNIAYVFKWVYNVSKFILFMKGWGFETLNSDTRYQPNVQDRSLRVGDSTPPHPNSQKFFEFS